MNWKIKSRLWIALMLTAAFASPPVTLAGWTIPSLVNTNAATDEGTDSTPHLLEGSDGTFHAVWHSDEDLERGGT